MLSRQWIKDRAKLVRLFADGARAREALFLLRHRPGGSAGGAGSVQRDELSRSIREGIGYLERAQHADGLWRGFVMGPVVSTEWISAHVLFVLEDVPQAHGIGERVVPKLLASGQRRDGWGFNRRAGVDSDSTAQGIMVLQRDGHEIAPAWVERLLAARCEDGGFATYASRRADGRPSTWWEMPHTDVTLMAIEALERLDRCEDERHEASEWLDTQLVDGILPAYWWPKPAYSLWAQARAGFRLSETSQAAMGLLEGEEDPVHLAMLIVAALTAGDWSPAIASAVARLVSKRRSDGSWLCGPCLRITPNDAAGHGPDAPGKVYADRYRVFSTAHAVAALHRALTTPGLHAAQA